MLNSINNPFNVVQTAGRVGSIAILLALAACDAVWKPVDSAPGIVQTPQAISSLTVKARVNRLEPPFNKKISLALPGGEEIVARLSKFEKLGSQAFVWRGAIEGDEGGRVLLSVVNGRLVGKITKARGRLFSIRYVHDDIVLVEELDPGNFPPEDAHLLDYRSRPGQPGALIVDRGILQGPVRFDSEPQLLQIAQTSGKSIINVLVLYTAAAAATEQGDAEAMEAVVNALLVETNDSYIDSDVLQELTLAHVEQTEYVDGVSPSADLHALNFRAEEEGDENLDKLDGLDALRSTYAADVVVLLSKPALNKSESCGTSNPMDNMRASFCKWAFAVVPITCATTQHSFAHELGHVMGAGHRIWGGTLDPPFPKSHGFVAASKKWRTIMTIGSDCGLPSCQREPVWSSSNPAVVYSETNGNDAEPTGDAYADNASSLNTTRDIVSKFSDSCSAVPPPST